MHGAGYLQEAHSGWSYYFHEFMFNTFLTRHGYVVLDMDYRASAGYGRDWRTAIYRQMGHPELEDLAGRRRLARGSTSSVDRPAGRRLRRLLRRLHDLHGALPPARPLRRRRRPAAGLRLGALQRGLHLGHPQPPEIDPEAYDASSPIEYAAGLRKPLLICDGMQDDNVFFQDNVRLVQRLIELKKENFELAIYPVEGHGFVQPTSWLDEYRRIFKLFEAHLKG